MVATEPVAASRRWYLRSWAWSAALKGFVWGEERWGAGLLWRWRRRKVVVAIAVKMKAAGRKDGLARGAKCGMLSADGTEFI